MVLVVQPNTVRGELPDRKSYVHLLSCNLKKLQNFSKFPDETDGIRGRRTHSATHLQTIGIPQLFGTTTALKNTF